MVKAAIYHFTDVSNKRPRICIDQINQLKKYTESLGFSVTKIFCDKSILRCERTEFDHFLSGNEEFDVLITKDFYHISKNTMKCMSIMKELSEKKIKIYTLEDGQFVRKSAPFDKPLRVATYVSHFGESNAMKQILQVNNDILSLFIKKKTNWTIIEQYFDESKYKKDGEQVQLMKLVRNREKYDLVLVHNLNHIHWRTANFCKIRKRLQLDIYSLQEGYLEYY